VVAAVVGVVLLVVGWLGVSGSSLTTQQIPYLASGAIGGLFALGVGATLWLSADLRNEFVKLDEIYQWLQGESRDDGEIAASPAYEAPTYQLESAPEPESEYAAPTPRRRPLRARPAGTLEP
jgi:hypothetical protein